MEEYSPLPHATTTNWQATVVVRLPFHLGKRPQLARRDARSHDIKPLPSRFKVVLIAQPKVYLICVFLQYRLKTFLSLTTDIHASLDKDVHVCAVLFDPHKRGRGTSIIWLVKQQIFSIYLAERKGLKVRSCVVSKHLMQ